MVPRRGVWEGLARSQGDFGQIRHFGRIPPCERRKGLPGGNPPGDLPARSQGDFGQNPRFGRITPWERAKCLKRVLPGDLPGAQNGAILWGLALSWQFCRNRFRFSPILWHIGGTYFPVSRNTALSKHFLEKCRNAKPHF